MSTTTSLWTDNMKSVEKHSKNQKPLLGTSLNKRARPDEHPRRQTTISDDGRLTALEHAFAARETD